ncbi:ribosome maturation factor RimM [Salibacteraceae bacterium]|nr:ribosome maturation factor RimM [Salibacteraceae bacterium]
MSKNEHTEIGVVVKPHGLKGEIVLKIEANFSDVIDTSDVLFVNHNGSMVPFILESTARLNKGLVKVKFAGINSAAEVDPLRGRSVMQLTAQLNIENQLDLVGFAIHDKLGEVLGEIQYVNDSGVQTLLEVLRNGCEIYIPLVSDFIVEVDESKKVLILDLPDGILDL